MELTLAELQKMGSTGLPGFLGIEVSETSCVPPWDDKHVAFSDRLNIHERHGPSIFMNHARFALASSKGTEEAVDDV